MELTKAEIELINEKRANDLELKKANAIDSANKTIAKYMLEYAKRLDAYQKFTHELNDASMSKGCGTRLFDLVVTEFEHSEIPCFYDNDNEFKLVELEPIKYIGFRFEIKFLGETVESENSYYINEDGNEDIDYRNDNNNSYKKPHTYTINVVEHITGGYITKNYGFKMNINGLLTGYDKNRNNGNNIKNAEKVITKIKEDIDIRKRIIENKVRKNSLKEKAILEAKALFPNAEITECDGKLVTVKFKNGTSIDYNYYDNDNNKEIGVVFLINRINANGVDPIILGNMLQILSKK